MLCCFNRVLAQPPTFFKTYYLNDNYGPDGIQTPDSGFAMVTLSQGKAFLVKANANGDSLWSKYYERAAYSSIALSITDSCLVMTGASYIVKTDKNGDTIWTREYGNYNLDGSTACSIKCTKKGDYIIAGQRKNDICRVPYIKRYDTAGNLLWENTYVMSPSGSGASYINETSDGGFIIMGDTGYSSGTNTIGSFILKINGKGDSLWSRYFVQPFYLRLSKGIIPTSDKGHIQIANIRPYGQQLSTAFVATKTDSLGGKIWEKTYSGSCGSII